MIQLFSTIIKTAKDLEWVFDKVKYKLFNNPVSGRPAKVPNELSLILEFIEKETAGELEIIFSNSTSRSI